MFRLLRDRASNSDIVYSSPPYPPFPHCVFHNPSLHFRNPIELPQPPPHSRYHHLAFEILSSRFFRFLRCFGYLGTSLHHLGISIKITATDGNLHIILVSWYPSIVYSLAIALLTPSVTFAPLAYRDWPFEYCRQRYLCTLVIILPIAYIPYHIGIISSLVSQVCSRIHTIAILVCAFCKVAIHTKRRRKNKLLRKREEQRSL